MSVSVRVNTPAAAPASETSIWQVIMASAVGTMIEWYDFYIFGSLATVISPLFYPAGNNTLALIAYLSTFAVGFVVRPFGALFFGRIGDLVGRKYAFLVTLVLMGGSTALIGFLPTYASIGILAPIALLVIRVLRMLAVPLVLFAVLDAIVRTEVSARMGGRLILICMFNVSVAFAIGLTIMNVLEPGNTWYGHIDDLTSGLALEQPKHAPPGVSLSPIENIQRWVPNAVA